MYRNISNIKYKCVICKKKFKGSETFRNHLCLMRDLDPKLFITIVEGVILIKNAKYGIFNRSTMEKDWT